MRTIAMMMMTMMSSTSTSTTVILVNKDDKQQPNKNKAQHSNACLTRSNSIALLQAETPKEKILYWFAGLLVGVAVCAFAVTFPLYLFPTAAVPTYQAAGYVYEAAKESHFDNTAWTYSTDYLIAIAMVYQMLRFPRVTSNNAVLTWRSKALLASYAASVVCGGVCHQYYTALEQRNTWHFRVLWTCCVGSVTAGVAMLGAIATELVRQDEILGLAFVPALPGWFWCGVGTTTTAACAAGYFSYQRPACDIFVAGVAQSIPTFYLMATLWRGLPTFASIDRWTRVAGLIAFIMMSATLPSYPLAVQYSGWSLGTVNALLHVWLCAAWSAQGVTLRRIATALALPATATYIPVKKDRSSSSNKKVA